MTSEFKKRIIKYIREKDPHRELVVELQPNTNYTDGKIEYNRENLVLHRNISRLKDEEYVRAYLVVKLVKELKYPAQCVELEKEYEAGRPKKIKPRIDILVKDKRTEKESTYLFIETKKTEDYEKNKNYIEGQLFKLAAIEDKSSKVRYLVYYTVKENPDQIEDIAIIIDFNLYQSFDVWQETGQISLDNLPTEYGVARKYIYVNKDFGELEPDEKRLDTKVTRERFNTLRKDLHNVLWGGGGMNYNDVFSNLVKLFLAKIFDEEM